MDQNQAPHFIKPMLPGFSQKLFIPSAFLKHLVGQRCDKAILTSLTRKEWHVKVGRGDESLWFEEGWADFVEGHDIGVGEFLMFRHEGDMVFHVTIFGTSACERGPPPPPPPPQDGNHVNDFRGNTPKNGKAVKVLGKKGKAVKGVVGSAKAECSSFKATIYPSNLLRCAPYMNIPKVFRDANGLLNIDEVTLVDPKGRSWPIKVSHRKRGESTFSSIGWYQFSVANDLDVGDVCIFRLGESVIEVSIIRRSRE